MTSLSWPGVGRQNSVRRSYFIGNATTWIRFGWLTILTDPAFLHKGEHVNLVTASGPARVEPACQDRRPATDRLVILSHYHGRSFR